MWGYPGSCGIGIAGGAFGIGMVFMIIFWGIIIWAIIALIRHFSGGSNSDWHMRTKDDAALRILNERYAKGEISKEEYEERKATLIK